MANINNNKYVTDKFGRTGIIEPTIIASSNLEDITINVNSGTPTGTTTTVPIPDFWRASTVSATTLPTGLNSFTAKAQNSNDTTKFIQHSADIFIGGADGLVRAGQGSGNIATNTVFGKNALRSNTTGYDILAVGNSALQANTTGYRNVALGPTALASNTTGFWNVAIGGINTLASNTTGYANVAIGVQALEAVTTANSNTAVGFQALRFNTTSQNTAFGTTALGSQTTGTKNVAVGWNAAQSITTGSYNTVIGSGSNAGTASGLTTGNDNIAIGSLFQTLGGFPNPIGTASQNILMGNGSAFKLTGNLNTIIGTYSGTITNGSNNVILGSYSYAPQTGSGWSQTDAYPVNNNTFIGNDYNRNVGAQIAIGNNNTALGFNINQRIVGITNATAIGANTASTKSNQISMGDANVTEILLSGKLAIDINAIFGAADGTPIVVKTVGGIKTITIQ